MRNDRQAYKKGGELQVRLRRAKIEHEDIRIDVDFRQPGGLPLQSVAIVGGNCTGKSLLMHCALKLFQSTAQSTTQQRAFTNYVNATIEFEYNGGIHAGVIKNGIITQKPSTTQMMIQSNRMSDGCLFYDYRGRLNANIDQCHSFGQCTCYMALRDFYRNEIRNCVVWIDDFDVGLDDQNAVTLFRLLLRKCFERDNQLIVTGHRAAVYEGLGDLGVKQLPASIDIVQRYLKNLG